MGQMDRVVVVTGGGKGIGFACARRFGKGGFKVVIAEKDEAAGREAETELKGLGIDALYVHCDVGERLDIHNLLAATLDAYNRVDVLINNAGIVASGTFLDVDEAEFDKVMRVNLRGAFLTGQAMARQMVKQIEVEGAGIDERRCYAIINMSSVNAVMAIPDQVPYAVSKGALNQLTKVMALSLAGYGIRVNAIGPGSINTDVLKNVVRDSSARKKVLSRTPLGRIGEADEIASIAWFLAGPDASYVTGQCVYADGGRLALNYTVEPSASSE